MICRPVAASTSACSSRCSARRQPGNDSSAAKETRIRAPHPDRRPEATGRRSPRPTGRSPRPCPSGVPQRGVRVERDDPRAGRRRVARRPCGTRACQLGSGARGRIGLQKLGGEILGGVCVERRRVGGDHAQLGHQEPSLRCGHDGIAVVAQSFAERGRRRPETSRCSGSSINWSASSCALGAINRPRAGPSPIGTAACANSPPRTRIASSRRESCSGNAPVPAARARRGARRRCRSGDARERPRGLVELSSSLESCDRLVPVLDAPWSRTGDASGRARVGAFASAQITLSASPARTTVAKTLAHDSPGEAAVQLGRRLLQSRGELGLHTDELAR